MACSQEEMDWQSTKQTVLERSRHMFNNSFLSDIVFTCEGSEKKFSAHKYVLATSSSVFYAMFYGELAEKNSVVHLRDANEESLEEFLRFLYTDKCEFTLYNAMLVLYLAKKYIVPSLAQKCIKFLEANLAAENAFVVLQQALQFDEKELENKCWDLIDLKTNKVLASEAFTDITQATLAKLLKRETLKIKEVELFKAVLKWSEAECLRKEIEANSENRRNVLGVAIYQIRFASMTAQEFAQNTSDSGLLTPEEMVLFYEKLSGVEKVSDVWNMLERGATQKETFFHCSRFQAWQTFAKPIKSNKSDVIGVSFSKAVKIHGVHLFGNVGFQYDVKLEVKSTTVQKKCHATYNNDRTPGFYVMLPEPIKVQPNVGVQFKANISGACHTCGVHGSRRIEIHGITVFFFGIAVPRSKNTTVERGQFSEIIFTEF